GTLITPQHAQAFKKAGISYVGVSLDGTQTVNDRFRGVAGAFEKAMVGIENCRAEGIKVGLRFTITKHNHAEVPEVFRILREQKIPRVCFYHLVYSGRGSQMVGEDLDRQQTRSVVDRIINETALLHRNGYPAEVLTVDNHADGVYLYLRLLREDPERAAKVLQLLEYNGGNASGHGIGCVSWDGSVHPDQFWRHLVLGNVRERGFADIWTDRDNELLMKIKNKKSHVTGRCARCRWLGICGGNFRVRAEAVTGDLWAPDPACYLSDEEIGL
ncbi:MAG TPA: SPASM domain-containing protein, partial [bacterium]|nr:SPASM domain-containing protein [bacterium]